MALLIDAWRLIVKNRLQDTAGKLSPTAIDSAITEAVKRYSQGHPRERVQTITGDGTAFTFAVEDDFEDGFSSVTSIEYPAGEREPVLLDENDFAVRRQSDNTLKLQLYALVLPDNAEALVTYTIRHSVTEDPDLDTVPAADREAVCKLAAAIGFRALASLYAQSEDVTIGAVALERQTKSGVYLRLAADLEKSYEIDVGEADGVVPAGAMRALGGELQNNAGDRFWHPRGMR